MRRLGAGLDNQAYEVNGELVVRLAREPGVVRREADLLEWVGKVSTLPVPQPVFVLPEDGCLAYRKLGGTPLIDLPPEVRSQCALRVAAELAGLLGVLHAVDVDQIADLVDIDDEPLDAWRDEAADIYASVASVLTPERQRSVEAFLQSPLPAPASRLVFSHNDLGIEHVLVDESTYDVAGVIDWSDAAICDPARDLGLILRDLGPAAYDAAASRLPADEGLADRAWFYARCSLLEDLHYGLEADRPTYVEKSLPAADWLFT
ncbi:phosphotransferase family protein [Kribbella sp. NPDC002412]